MNIDFDNLFDTEVRDHIGIAAATLVDEVLRGRLGRLVVTAATSVRAGGKIILFGNGGSAADAQHIAAELVGKLMLPRGPIPAIALTTDTSILTAVANDIDFGAVFGRQIMAIGKGGDLAIGISTSGRSANVIQGLSTALESGLCTAALTGGDGGGLRAVAATCLIVPSDNTARIQEAHIMLGHIFCAALERELGLV